MRNNTKSTVEEVFTQLNKQFGINNVKQLSDLPETKDSVVSTGIIGLDLALGVGGIRKGSIVEIYAPESAGKTTLALQLCKQYQKQKMPVLYIDSERTLTKETVESVGIKSDNFYIMNVDTLEKALEVCKMSAPAFGAIVIDSLAGLVPKAQIDGDVGDIYPGLFTRTMSDTLPVLVPILADSGCTLIAITQLREKIGVMFGNPERATGGRALKYYASVRLDMRRIETLKRAGEEIGNKVRIKVIKNKVAAPFKETEVDIIFGKGISVEGDMLDRAVERDIISRQGASYLYGSKIIGQGREDAKNYLEQHMTESKEITNKLRKVYKIA